MKRYSMIYGSGGSRKMKKKIVYIFVCMLLVTTILPLTALAGDPENPEVIDRIRDVKLFGVITIPFQMEYKYADVVAAWLHEDSATPDYLSVSLQIRDLQDKTESLEAIYNVDWIWNNNRFIVNLHINPQGIGSFIVGRSFDYNDDIEEWIACDGTVDLEKNIITWSVPKEFMQNIRKGSMITSIGPSTDLRFTDASGLPLMDLFKDLSWNAKSSKDYVIEY
jgi:hypothetical protein